MREKWIGIEPKDLGESSAERNRKFTLTKREKKKEKTESSREEEIFNRYKSRKYSPFNKSDFTSPQL